MVEYSEKYEELNIRQCQVDGWVDGTYNTRISYNGKDLAIKYHFHASDREQRKKISPNATIYNLTNELETIPRCNFFKKMLDDICFLKKKIEMKLSKGHTYDFDLKFVGDVLKDTVNVINGNVKKIYDDISFETKAKGRDFFVPLPDYTHDEVNCLGNESSMDIMAVNNDNFSDEIIELIRQTKENTDLIIKLTEGLQNEKEEKGIIDIIKELVKVLQLKPEPKEGKYIPTSDCKKFIFWIVDHNYDEYLNQYNFCTFIFCDVKEDTIKKYYQEAKNGRK